MQGLGRVKSKRVRIEARPLRMDAIKQENLFKRCYMELFTVTRTGVYAQGVFGIYGSQDLAQSAIDRALEIENDDYHRFVIHKFTLNQDTKTLGTSYIQEEISYSCICDGKLVTRVPLRKAEDAYPNAVGPVLSGVVNGESVDSGSEPSYGEGTITLDGKVIGTCKIVSVPFDITPLADTNEDPFKEIMSAPKTVEVQHKFSEEIKEPHVGMVTLPLTVTAPFLNDANGVSNE